MAEMRNHYIRQKCKIHRKGYTESMESPLVTGGLLCEFLLISVVIDTLIWNGNTNE